MYIAIANTMYEIKVPDIDMPRIFLRPYLSESWPSIGAERNCMNGKIALRSPYIMYPLWTTVIVPILATPARR